MDQTFLLRLLLGSLASVIAKTLSAPLERIKLVEQGFWLKFQRILHKISRQLEIPVKCLKVETDEEEMIQKKQPTGFVEVLTHIYREQGFWSFWNGNYANCLRSGKLSLFSIFDSKTYDNQQSSKICIGHVDKS